MLSDHSIKCHLDMSLREPGLFHDNTKQKIFQRVLTSLSIMLSITLQFKKSPTYKAIIITLKYFQYNAVI